MGLHSLHKKIFLILRVCTHRSSNRSFNKLTRALSWFSLTSYHSNTKNWDKKSCLISVNPDETSKNEMSLVRICMFLPFCHNLCHKSLIIKCLLRILGFSKGLQYLMDLRCILGDKGHQRMIILLWSCKLSLSYVFDIYFRNIELNLKRLSSAEEIMVTVMYMYVYLCECT